MLNGRRVLDLTDEKGFLCGKILADMGADVIKIEKPGGKESSRIGPFYRDIPDPKNSLYWLCYNAGKRGITLDISRSEGQKILIKLIRSSDFLIDSFSPGYMEKIGLGYESLMEINPKMVIVSITPFGQTGPYKDFNASDIVIMGMSGMLFLTGDSDRAPLNMSIPQSYLLAGSDGAVGAMMAHYNMKKTGKGQFVDVSLQQSTAWFLAFTIPTWEMGRTNLTRTGVLRSNAMGALQKYVWPCKDGYVFFFILGGLAGAKTARQVVKWMEEKGMSDEFLCNMDWQKFDMGTATQEVLDRIAKPIGVFFLKLTKKEIITAAIERNIMVSTLLDMDDLLNDRHLKERKFWTEFDYPELGIKLPYPRRFAEMSDESVNTKLRAPSLGEHNTEVYNELGLTDLDIDTLRQVGVI